MTSYLTTSKSILQHIEPLQMAFLRPVFAVDRVSAIETGLAPTPSRAPAAKVEHEIATPRRCRPRSQKAFPPQTLLGACQGCPSIAALSSLGGDPERGPRKNTPPISTSEIGLHFLVRLRWSGTDLEARFVIYAESGPGEVFGMSLGVRMCTPYGISQTPRAPGRGTPVAPPAAAHAPLRRPVGGGEVACE